MRLKFPRLTDNCKDRIARIDKYLSFDHIQYPHSIARSIMFARPSFSYVLLPVGYLTFRVK
jgi:hypothetical protein